ncbi:MAG: OsmC family protein [Myxococcota bacterium]
MSDAKFSVVGVSETAARMKVQARNFELTVDEPPALGGDDQGANPVEYVLAGLVGCLNVMYHLIAREMDIEIKRLEINAEGPINLDKLFGKSTDDRPGYKSIQLTLNIETNASADQIEALRTAVETRCPVSDNLLNLTPVETRINLL